MRLVLRRSAERDVLEAFLWYEAQKPGLGAEFQAKVEECFARILEHPRGYARVCGEARSVRPFPFPYQVFFRLRGNAVVVLAVVHSARDPKGWRKRIG